jgi:hypothetical protein
MIAAVLAALALQSSAFEANAQIPTRFTCQGANETPPLSIAGVPAGAKSLALIVDDPDAPDPAKPKRTWVHWVVYDLPASAGELRASAGRAGTGDAGNTGWKGPCPPIGRHRYFFKLYALDVQLGDRGELGKAELEKAMQGHVLEKTELVGTYGEK